MPIKEMTMAMMALLRRSWLMDAPISSVLAEVKWF